MPSLRSHLRMRQHVRYALDSERTARRSLLELPPLLYGHATAGGHGRPDRALQSQVWSQSSIVTPAARGAPRCVRVGGGSVFMARLALDSVAAPNFCPVRC